MIELLTLDDASALINEGRTLLIAGSEKCISKLPKGNWIGGTIPYFMTPDGGLVTESKVQVTKLSEVVANTKIVVYEENSLQDIPKNYFDNGMSLIIMPAFSSVQAKYAEDCSTWSGLFNQPLVGWVSGVNLSSPTDRSMVMNGKTGEIFYNSAIVMHIQLQDSVSAVANIINIFEQDNGDIITFPKSGFEVTDAFVNGKKVVFSDYLKENKIDFQLPLVADYMGAMVNVSFRDLNEQTKSVRMFAPVFPNVNYKLAKPFLNYEKQFEAALKKHDISNPLFSCNCVLNFLYANLEGKKMGDISSAMTFGEVAYMLLNQTFVYVTAESKK
jgi:hypothetical protein